MNIPEKETRPVYRFNHERRTMALKIVKEGIPEDEMISNPSHYTEGRRIQPIEVLEDWNLNHHLACALKYIARAGRKHDEVKDLKKAVWYLQRRIKLLEKQEK